MATGTYEWNELSDARELLEARTPSVITWFLGIFLVTLAAAIGWSCLYSMDTVVKARAVVRPNSQISTVSSNVQGKVKERLYQSGQHVQKGDVLLRIELDNMPQLKEDLTGQLNKSTDDLKLLTDLGTRAASTAKAETWEVGDSEAGAKWKVAFEQNEYSREQYQRQLDNAGRLLNSIERGRNLFQSSEPDYEKYETYRLRIAQLEAAKNAAAEAYKLEIRTNGEVDYGDNVALANAQRDLDSYRSQYLVDLNTSIEESRSRLHQLQLDRDSLLVQLQEAIEGLRLQTQDLNRKLSEFNLQLSDRTIKAPINGVVNEIQPLAEGDLVEVGASLLNLVPEEGAEYVMQLAIANRDIASIKPGTLVKYNFQALPAKDYGYLNGTIDWLGPDAVVDSGSGQSYYTGEATLQGQTLRDKRGMAAEVKVGMVAEAHMITDHETIMQWVLKKLDLFK